MKKALVILRKIFNKILNLIFPETCMFCDSDGHVLCENCRYEIDKKFRPEKSNLEIDGNLINFISAFNYNGIVAQVIKKFKFGHKNAGEFLSKYLKRAMDFYKINFDMITFVPMSARKQENRKFNQSEILAKKLSEIVDRPVFCLLKKSKENLEQKGLDFYQRKSNVRNVYEFDNNMTKKIEDKKIILIDDILTTGATIIECSRLINSKKPKEIICLILAKVNNTTTS
ncbi:MAG: ComF family protein [Candidatus Improbicoccus pseudotrichonymphae]|uniref:ComF family protein n=1 Tax=Candidatus Improbicoccus pseudotrichonymphae TaxID=3033792 RepID=A0AA48KWP9_9FIRM|nr:MAG: ComF family protein [Candidatus Improbicoccus pseudotrichonymphae]